VVVVVVEMMDEYSQADLDLYYDDGGGYGYGVDDVEEEATPVRERRRDAYGYERFPEGKGKEEEEEEEEEDEDDVFRAPLNPIRRDASGGGLGVKKRAIKLSLHEGNVVPLSKKHRSGVVVPFRVQMAANILLRENEINMSPGVINTLETLMHHDDEYTIVDPYVVLSDTIPNGGLCKVYMKEIVPVSVILLLRAMNCSYGVRFSANDRSEDRSYVTDVTVREFKDTNADHVQSFGCSDAIRDGCEIRNLDYDEVVSEVYAYMTKQGEQPSYVACSPEFLEAHVVEIKNILSGEATHLE
jgi:hypothetical protein